MVSTSLSIVGGLRVFSLLVNPASAASQLTGRLTTMLVLAALFGVLNKIHALNLTLLSLNSEPLPPKEQ